MKILITGGAGFIGSFLSIELKRSKFFPEVTVFDNLKRRGSERNIDKLKQHGINFVHGDIRVPEDFQNLEGPFDILIDASAEPSVLSGINTSPAYVINTNLTGTINCLEYARVNAPDVIFLSTSRVYSIDELQNIPLKETSTRFTIDKGLSLPMGCLENGVNEKFSSDGPKSFYGAGKLASEIFIQEYSRFSSIRSVINRCGVIAGPGQFGKTDQGVFTLWMINHYFKKNLQYMGFGGKGKQVRDILHPQDLFELILKQIEERDTWNSSIYNIGGGSSLSLSLFELTKICQEITGNKIKISSYPKTNSVDIPLYITDYTKAYKKYNWKPEKSINHIYTDIFQWLKKEELQLRSFFT